MKPAGIIGERLRQRHHARKRGSSRPVIENCTAAPHREILPVSAVTVPTPIRTLQYSRCVDPLETDFLQGYLVKSACIYLLRFDIDPRQGVVESEFHDTGIGSGSLIRNDTGV